LYGAAATWRRRWYARDPSRQRRLSRPVISVGNLRAGGRGKTPIVESIARLIAAKGGRPVILTRGYGRRVVTDDVTIVSDGSAILADVDHAGDEPMMLARHLPGVPVLVGADRYRSGCLAERRFGATVHLLDDGFQHLELARDVNLLAIGEEDLTARVIPAGLLREPLDAASAADALLADGPSEALTRFARDRGIDTAFRIVRTLGTTRWLAGNDQLPVPASGPAFAVAGIARPERFFEDARAAGWAVAGTLAFPDHHWFTATDIDRIARESRAAGAGVVLTTEKDAVRLEKLDCKGLVFAVVPLTASIEPAGAFAAWLFERLSSSPRSRGPGLQVRGPSTQPPVPR
jgi:tetraacyldisaccharide 4'-kinase